jgi:bacterial/archaeal transporter family-2 protein
MPSPLLLVAFVAGTALALQASCLGHLANALGSPVASATVSITVGVTFIWLAWLVAGQLGWAGRLSAMWSSPWWLVLGSGLGSVAVLLIALIVLRLGIAATVAATMGGQLLSAMLIDRLGLFGTPVLFTPSRVLGAALTLAGVLLLRGR